MESLQEQSLFSSSYDWIQLMGMKYLPSLALAIVTIIVGLFVIRLIAAGLQKACDRKDFDPSLTTFLKSLATIGLRVMLFISAAGMVGIETTSFVAAIGALGLAFGLALQGSLSNFAGAVLLLVFKPIRVGDYIESAGKEGTVTDIGIFMTRMLTVDNKVIYLPNGPLANSNITNYSQEPIRRLDLVFGVGYGDDLEKAKNLLESIIAKDSRFLKEPEATVGVLTLNSSSVDFAFRPWLKKEDYWPAYFDTLKLVKQEFDKAGITIPYPQTELHIAPGSANTLSN
ncbi:MAG: mechanosensitive ion channel [Bdellovibrionales bacterium]|nr:mechanosensitive ion channel [Bdellovibrionales bacterium]